MSGNRVWLVIEQNDKGYLVVKDGEGGTLAFVARTEPARGDASDREWAGVLVSDVERLARYAMSSLTMKNPASARF